MAREPSYHLIVNSRERNSSLVLILGESSLIQIASSVNRTGWLSKYDPIIKADACMYERYMDDILQNISKSRIEEKLSEINNLHPSLKFTIEREVNGSIPFLDMKIINESGRLSSTWYNKPTDTGLIMNFHALAPKRYKRSVVSGFIHRIHRACSTWKHFNKSLQRAKQILEKN